MRLIPRYSLALLVFVLFLSTVSAERTDVYSQDCYNALVNPEASLSEGPGDYSSAVGTGKEFASPHKLFGEADEEDGCFVSFVKDDEDRIVDYSFTVCDPESVAAVIREGVYGEIGDKKFLEGGASFDVFMASPRASIIKCFEEGDSTVCTGLSNMVERELADLSVEIISEDELNVEISDAENQKGLYFLNFSCWESTSSIKDYACAMDIASKDFDSLKSFFYSEHTINVEESFEDDCRKAEAKAEDERTEEDVELLGECSDKALIDEAVELIEEKLAKDPFYDLMSRGAFSEDKVERSGKGFESRESRKGKLLEVNLGEENEGEMFLSPTNASLLLLYLENSDPAGDKLGLFDDQIAFAQYVLKVKGKVFSEPDSLFEWSPYCSDNTEKRDFLGEYSALKEDAKIQSLIGALPAGVARTNYRDACENLGTENFGACSEEDYGLFYDLTGLEPGQRQDKKIAYISPIYYGSGSHELSLTGYNDDALLYSIGLGMEGVKSLQLAPVENLELGSASSSDVMSLVEKEKACVKYSNTGISYFWNPVKITEKAEESLDAQDCGKKALGAPAEPVGCESCRTITCDEKDSSGQYSPACTSSYDTSLALAFIQEGGGPTAYASSDPVEVEGLRVFFAPANIPRHPEVSQLIAGENKVRSGGNTGMYAEAGGRSGLAFPWLIWLADRGMNHPSEQGRAVPEMAMYLRDSEDGGWWQCDEGKECLAEYNMQTFECAGVPHYDDGSGQGDVYRACEECCEYDPSLYFGLDPIKCSDGGGTFPNLNWYFYVVQPKHPYYGFVQWDCKYLGTALKFDMSPYVMYNNDGSVIREQQFNQSVPKLNYKKLLIDFGEGMDISKLGFLGPRNRTYPEISPRDKTLYNVPEGCDVEGRVGLKSFAGVNFMREYPNIIGGSAMFDQTLEDLHDDKKFVCVLTRVFLSRGTANIASGATISLASNFMFEDTRAHADQFIAQINNINQHLRTSYGMSNDVEIVSAKYDSGTVRIGSWKQENPTCGQYQTFTQGTINAVQYSTLDTDDPKQVKRAVKSGNRLVIDNEAFAYVVNTVSDALPTSMLDSIANAYR